ncbi:MAG: homocysteine S-methyltransferase family protein [Arenicellales bacterium]
MKDCISWLEKRLSGNGPPVVIDGGMGTQLEKSAVPMDGKVWSGRAVLSHPHVVRQVHEDFIAAGAEVIIANTFASARHMLEPAGLGKEVKIINLNAVKLAQEARDSVAQEPVAIAGSICEWAPTDDLKWHTPEAVGFSTKEQAELLAEAGVDLIALEMCEQLDFSVAAIEAAMDTGLPIWIGMSAQTHKGCQSLSVFDYAQLDFESLVRGLSEFPAMMINVMHTPVSDVDNAMGIVKNYWDGPIGIYPESGYFKMPNWQFIDVIETDEFANCAKKWINNGARLVGGCCGLGPEHIATVRQMVNKIFENHDGKR